MAKAFNLSLSNLAYRLRKFDEILGKELVNVVLAHKEEILTAITQDQLYEQGINGAGVSIMSYQPYAPSTIKRKQKKGQPYNRVTLKDTGEWYKSLDLVYDVDGFYVYSTDDKNTYLKKRYGDKILRLSNSNLNQVLRDTIRPHLARKLKEYLQHGD